ncbi:hypothetical protein ACT3SQ_00670 [Brachybacterium sp. AOP42-C2-15]|uniref:hypothetical protein n=1 Tax=unclassified Brachybacterium TaxID=2623841 RepID=UPI003F8EDA76
MTSALIGLALILLIALVAVGLGTLTRLLASRIIAPRSLESTPLTPLERIALGNEAIARDLQPDSTHPVARTAARDAGTRIGDRPAQEHELAERYFFAATHGLR